MLSAGNSREILNEMRVLKVAKNDLRERKIILTFVFKRMVFCRKNETVKFKYINVRKKIKIYSRCYEVRQ